MAEIRAEIRETTDEFDFEKACRNMVAYNQATGENCFLIDSKGKMLTEAVKTDSVCHYCRESARKFGHDFSCEDVHRYGCYQAERFGGRYVFFCPMGFTHWVSPITSGGAIRGALVGGPVLMVAPEEFMFEDILGASFSPAERAEYANYIKNVPVVPTDRVNGLSELLFIVASSIAPGAGTSSAQRYESNAVQAKISESIQEIKRNIPMVDNVDESRHDYPFEKERLLLSSISLGDRAASQKVLNEILGYIFFSSGMDFNVIRARIFELTVLLSRAAIEGGADTSEIFGLNYRYLLEINSFNTIEELTFWLSKILSRFTDCVFRLADVRHKDVIFKSIDYIRKNYMKKITLEEVAGSVFLNPSYFSKIFKDEMGMSFVNYVNMIRVEKSKILLKDSTINLTDVSNLVGFEEQSYYTRVFKKIAGVTPGKYKKGSPKNH